MSIHYFPNWCQCVSVSGKFRAIPSINKKPGKCKIFSKKDILEYQKELLKRQQESTNNVPEVI